VEKPLHEMTNKELWELFPVILCAHDPAWAERFERERTLLEETAAGCVAKISHIGSTAVPGVVAKPTIDILLEIQNGADLDVLLDAMRSAGYIHSPQPRDPPPHMMFMKGYTPEGFRGQAFHVHVRYPGDWDELYFRDYLVEHREASEEYGRLKLLLKERFEHDRDGYTDAKTDFITRITRLARAEFGGRYAHA